MYCTEWVFCLQLHFVYNTTVVKYQVRAIQNKGIHCGCIKAIPLKLQVAMHVLKSLALVLGVVVYFASEH